MVIGRVVAVRDRARQLCIVECDDAITYLRKGDKLVLYRLGADGKTLHLVADVEVYKITGEYGFLAICDELRRKGDVIGKKPRPTF